MIFILKYKCTRQIRSGFLPLNTFVIYSFNFSFRKMGDDLGGSMVCSEQILLQRIFFKFFSFRFYKHQKIWMGTKLKKRELFFLSNIASPQLDGFVIF